MNRDGVNVGRLKDIAGHIGISANVNDDGVNGDGSTSSQAALFQQRT